MWRTSCRALSAWAAGPLYVGMLAADVTDGRRLRSSVACMVQKPRNSASPKSWTVMQPGALHVATEGDFPPFSVKDSERDKVYGIEASVMKEICKRLDLTYTPCIISWSRILDGLRNPVAGNFDISSASMDVTEERLAEWAFTRSYYAARCVVVSPASSRLGPGDLRGRRVATIEHSTFEAVLRAAGAELICTPDVGEVWLDLLEQGKADAFVTEEANAQALCSLSREELYVSPEPLATHHKAFAMPFGHQELLAAVDRIMSDMDADGSLAEKVQQGICMAKWAQNSNRAQSLESFKKPMFIDSCFDGGRIDVVDVRGLNAELKISPDAPDAGAPIMHWLFRASHMGPGQVHTFSLINSGDGSYPDWAGCHVYYSFDRQQWQCVDETTYDGEVLYWTHAIPMHVSTCYYAHSPP